MQMTKTHIYAVILYHKTILIGVLLPTLLFLYGIHLFLLQLMTFSSLNSTVFIVEPIKKTLRYQPKGKSHYQRAWDPAFTRQSIRRVPVAPIYAGACSLATASLAVALERPAFLNLVFRFSKTDCAPGTFALAPRCTEL